MLEELVKSIEKVKSIFNLDEIEKSLYFVNQSTILSERLAALDKEQERQKSLNLSMGIDLFSLKREELLRNYKKELEIFKRACSVKVEDNYLYVYHSRQIALNPESLDDNSFLYETGGKIYLFELEKYSLLDLKDIFFVLLAKNRCIRDIFFEDSDQTFSFEPGE